jgi:hypothetical protein
MKGLALLFAVAAASSVVACAPPKTCDPQPIPEQYKELGSLLPASAVVCGLDEQGKSLLVNFKERDVKKLALETNASLTAAGWAVGKTSNFDDGRLYAQKGPKPKQQLFVNIHNEKSGPNVGRVMGSFQLAVTK